MRTAAADAATAGDEVGAVRTWWGTILQATLAELELRCDG